MDIGESLVGSYMRHIRLCHTVAFNQFIPGKQGEIDVIGISGDSEHQQVWMAEVAIHLDNLNYGGYEATAAKVEAKVATAIEYCASVYRNDHPVVEFWSPVVPSGLVARLETLGVSLVLNEEFTRRVNELAALAASSTKQYGDESFRFLQILTHLKGARPAFSGSGERRS